MQEDAVLVSLGCTTAEKHVTTMLCVSCRPVTFNAIDLWARVVGWILQFSFFVLAWFVVQIMITGMMGVHCISLAYPVVLGINSLYYFLVNK